MSKGHFILRKQYFIVGCLMDMTSSKKLYTVETTEIIVNAAVLCELRRFDHLTNSRSWWSIR